MQAYLNAKKPAYRDGPSANQRSQKYSVCQFFIVKKSTQILYIESIYARDSWPVSQP